MNPGDKVEASAYGGKKIIRRVVQQIENTVVICTEEEWDAAEREMRIPNGVGFPIRDIRSISA